MIFILLTLKNELEIKILGNTIEFIYEQVNSDYYVYAYLNYIGQSFRSRKIRVTNLNSIEIKERFKLLVDDFVSSLILYNF